MNRRSIVGSASFVAAQERIDERVASLAPSVRAVFFAWAARGLLPVYQRFAERRRWRDAGPLQSAIELAERSGRSTEPPPAPELTRLSEELLASAPHDEDFDDPDTTGTQDALIAADAALRALRGGATAGSSDYILEHAFQALTYRRTGHTGLGSGAEADAWDHEIMNEPAMRAAIDAVDAALSSLEAGRPIVADARVLDPG